MSKIGIPFRNKYTNFLGLQALQVFFLKRISNDFKTLCNEWLPTKRYQDTTLAKQQIYIDEIISLIGNKPVTEITVSDCMALLKPLEKKGHSLSW